ncbi:UDP-N-acetylglucosamine 2-epimerase (non-hydrolyzing) [Candidatus Uhrbacteria bacterium]|nr:UDP-N-acetylglucosamine 2-epimerase (non-hydrolyzing) [Candidatus Uhrbacteria bacterium]
MKKIIANIVGARPNIMKIAPILKAYKKYPHLKPVIIHTGQHYDDNLSGVFLREFGISKLDYHLNVGSGSWAEQIGETLKALEQTLQNIRPDLVVVVGDVNSTLAGAITAKHLGLHVAHVEAGLRSFDLTMPEEINRMIVDRISDLLFVTEKDASANLKKEGVAKKKIHFVGNVMIDALQYIFPKRKEKNGRIRSRPFAVLTLHRPSNVDDKHTLQKIASILKKVAQMGIEVIFPVHPRTKKNIETFYLQNQFRDLTIVPPLSYGQFITLISDARFVLTDSGGIQEEASWLRIPCLTMRKNTERPITVKKGTNTLVDLHEDVILANVKKIMGGRYKKGQRLPLWDGKAAERVVKKINDYLRYQSTR